MQTFFEDRYQQVDRDCNPDLGAHGVLAGAEEGFDAQVLFDPFEEQLDLPSAAVELRNGQRGQGEVVGQKDQRLAGLRIVVADAAQFLGVGPAWVETAQHHRLVEAQAGAFVHRVRVAPGKTAVLAGASEEESRMLRDAIQTPKVQVAPVHDVERASLVDQLIQNVHIVHASGRNNNDGGKVPLQRKQGVKLDCGFVPAKGRPGKERQAQVDGGGVQGIGGLLQFGGKRFVGIEPGGLPNEDLSEIREDAPVASFVGIGQRAAGGGLAYAAVIELGAQGVQTRFDVPQALAPGQLSKGHDGELFVAGELARAEIAAVALHTFVEFVLGDVVQQLGKNGAAFVHKDSGPPELGGARPCGRNSRN